jgi:hypothetical protein
MRSHSLPLVVPALGLLLPLLVGLTPAAASEVALLPTTPLVAQDVFGHGVVHGLGEGRLPRDGMAHPGALDRLCASCSTLASHGPLHLAHTHRSHRVARQSTMVFQAPPGNHSAAPRRRMAAPARRSVERRGRP